MLSMILFAMIGIIIEAPIWYWITLGVFCMVKLCLWVIGEIAKAIAKAARDT